LETIQKEQKGKTLTIRVIDDGGWFGKSTKEVIYEDNGVTTIGTINEDGTIVVARQEYMLSDVQNDIS